MLKDMGPSTRILNLARNLAALGHEVHIIIPGGNETFELIDRVIIHRINGLCPNGVLKFLSSLVGALRSTSLYFYDLSFILRACRTILKSDVIQIEESWGGALITLLLTKIFRKPVIVEDRDTFQALRIRRKGLRKILEVFLEKVTCKYANLIIVVSEPDKKFLIRYMPTEQGKIVIVPNGVDTEAFTPVLDTTLVQNRYNLKNFRIVVFVGNMEYQPNQEAVSVIASELAPRVQSKIKNVKFLMIGKLPPKNPPYSCNLIFTGVVKNVAEFLVASDVAIAPLFSGSGVRFKILEYFSCGLPVVSTKIGVEGLEVKNGENVLIEDDINKFATKVIRLLKDRALSMKLGRAARDLVIDKYDWGKIVKQLDMVYYTLLSNKCSFTIGARPLHTRGI